ETIRNLPWCRRPRRRCSRFTTIARRTGRCRCSSSAKISVAPSPVSEVSCSHPAAFLSFPSDSGGVTGGRTVMRALVVTLAALLSAAAPAAAQYFGRNKVQVESFDFRVLPTAHFDVYYYPVERDAAEQAARMAERWYTRLSAALDHTLID